VRCIGIEKCGRCLKACSQPQKRFALEQGFVKGVDRSCCDLCLKCVEFCPSGTIQIWGQMMTVSQVMDHILRDRSLYLKSGGGVTISGGECLLQLEFVLAILEACRSQKIHTCVETSLHCHTAHVEAVLPLADMIISDIKHMDSAKHKSATGVRNEQILSNLVRVTEFGLPLILRVPIVPGYNDDEENIAATAAFIRDVLGNKILQLQLLRFRKLGEEKYASLGMPYPMQDFAAPERDVFEAGIREIADYFVSQGIPAIAGTTQKPK